MKFLHTADIHLDTPFSMLDPEKAEQHRNELRSTFASLVLYAKAQKVDLFLIAGDLFNNSFVTRETLSFLRREFESVPDCRFVIAPGNHDCFTEFSAYAKADFPPNVFLFSKPHVSCFSFDEIGVNVWGFAWCSKQFSQHVLSGFSLPPTKSINIFLGHADVSGAASSVYAPITKEEIDASGFDYMALGHIHNSDSNSRIRDTYYGYSGCLEGRGFDETGYKGALVAELSKQNGVCSFNAKRLRFSKRHYEKETLDITGAGCLSDVAERIRAMLREKKYDSNTGVRVELTGHVSARLCPDAELLQQALPPLLRFEVQDNTVLESDVQNLRTDPTIRGAFYESLLPYLQSEDAAQRALGAAALRYGLDALESTAGR